MNDLRHADGELVIPARAVGQRRGGFLGLEVTLAVGGADGEFVRPRLRRPIHRPDHPA